MDAFPLGVFFNENPTLNSRLSYLNSKEHIHRKGHKELKAS